MKESLTKRDLLKGALAGVSVALLGSADAQALDQTYPNAEMAKDAQRLELLRAQYIQAIESSDTIAKERLALEIAKQIEKMNASLEELRRRLFPNASATDVYL